MKLIKNYKELGHKEFMNRWKEGIKKTSMLELTEINLFSYYLVFAGVISGIVITYMQHVYWLMVILFGSLFLTGTSYISTLQKYYVLKEVEGRLKEYGDKSNRSVDGLSGSIDRVGNIQTDGCLSNNGNP